MSGVAEVTKTQMRAYDEELAERVLRPYRPECRYLTSCETTVEGDPGSGARVVGVAEFAIGESWYIADTGHFNSVEFNLCSNQLAYYLLAQAAQDGLLSPFSRWTMDEFWDRQLGNMLIADLKSSFRRPVESSSFRGEMTITKVVERRGIVVVHLGARFWDAAGGNCHGELRVAVVEPPA